MLSHGGTLELVEKILDEDDAMIGVFLLDRQQRDDPAVGRGVDVSPLADIRKAALGPRPRLAGVERIAGDGVRDRHHAVVGVVLFGKNSATPEGCRRGDWCRCIEDTDEIVVVRSQRDQP